MTDPTTGWLAANTPPPADPTDFVRNQHGAPKVTAPDNPDRWLTYGRPSSFGGALDSPHNLIRWKERQVLIGAAALTDRLAATDPTDPAALDRLVAACHAHAGSSIAAERGTHIHLLTEHHDRGDDWSHLTAAGEALGMPAEAQRAIVEAWATFRADLTVEAVAVEARVVNDPLRLAGTLDRLDRARRPIVTPYGTIDAGQTFIGDIKTGRLSTDRNGRPRYWTKYPIQLAVYATATPYNTATNQRERWPSPPDQRVALIYHLDVNAVLDGQVPRWQAIPVGLAAGVEGCRIAAEARTWRPDFGAPLDLTAAAPLPATHPDRLAARLTRIAETIGDDARQVILLAWPDGVPGLKQGGHTDEQLHQILDAVQRLEQIGGLPFHEDDGDRPPEEGAADPGRVEANRVAYKQLPADRRAIITRLAKDAADSGYAFDARRNPTHRRVTIGEALTAWAATGHTEERLFAEVAAVADGHRTTAPAATLGYLLGTLTATQAARLKDIFTITETA